MEGKKQILKLTNFKLIILLVPILQIKLNRFMSHWFIVTFIIILTLFALFGYDFRLAFFSKGSDDAFSYLTAIIIGIFTVEITLNAISEDKYINSFYFWLDTLSTISLLLDISWVIDSAWDHYGDDFTTTDTTEAGIIAQEVFTTSY